MSKTRKPPTLSPAQRKQMILDHLRAARELLNGVRAIESDLADTWRDDLARVIEELEEAGVESGD